MSEEMERKSVPMLRIEHEMESSEVFKEEDRVPTDWDEDKVLEELRKKEKDDIIVNGIIPYRDALKACEDRYLDFKAKYQAGGFTLLTHPFIPEYLDFTEHFSESGKRYYVKNDCILSSNFEGGWIIAGVVTTPTNVDIANMLQGIYILQGFGVEINLEEVLEK